MGVGGIAATSTLLADINNGAKAQLDRVPEGSHIMTMTSFEDWSAGKARPRFTDWLKDLAEPTWSEAVAHKFTVELASGTLPDHVMRRYLVQDYSFLDSFVKLVGNAIAQAPSLADRIPLCRFVGMVTSEENTYFQRALDALEVPVRERTNPALTETTEGFHAIMAEAAKGGAYAESITVLVVFEWLYLSWATAVSDRAPDKFYLAEWITLHANPEFAAFVDWLRGQLDRDGPELPAAARTCVVDLFRRTVALELAFFDQAYRDSP